MNIKHLADSLNEERPSGNQLGLEVDMIPVGSESKSGDCFAIRYGDLAKGKKDQRVVVIDGGYAKTAESLITHLRQYYNCEINGKLNIDLMILSHPDLDHISGLVELLKCDEVKVNKIVASFPWTSLDSDWFDDDRMTERSLEKRLKESFAKLKELYDLAAEKRIPLCSPNAGQKGTLFGATFHFLNPSEDFYNTCIANCSKTPQAAEDVEILPVPQHSNKNTEYVDYVKGQIDWPENDCTSPINESSIVFLLGYGNFKGLFCGDAGKGAFAEVLKNAKTMGLNLKEVNFIKMPHHGSRKNLMPAIMDKIGVKSCPCYIPCVDGDEGHPSNMLVNMLIEKGFRVYLSNNSTYSHKSGTCPSRSGWSGSNPIGPFNKIEKV